jgi:methenyltetrahydrofolate cyclohydrolase
MTDAPSDSSSAAGDPYLRSTVADFLDALADRTPAPGGGATAALACAMAAGLVEMASSFASNLGALEGARERAHTLRAESSRLAYADGRAYGVVLEALRMPNGPERTRRLDEAVSVSIQIPMRIMEIAAEVSVLAAEIAETGNKNLEGDALSGALLAEASARSAATLAQLNVSMLSKHAAAVAHLERLRPALARATRARERAVLAFVPPARSCRT